MKQVDSATLKPVSINHPTGTRVSYKPGVITGGEHTHDCGLQRSIGYYLEPLVLLAPFAKKPCIITLRGVDRKSVV